MLQVCICVGSSCHLRGSYHIIRIFQELIKKNKLEDKVELKASFCLGQCTQGVSVKVDEECLGGFTPANAEEKFKEYVIGRLPAGN